MKLARRRSRRREATQDMDDPTGHSEGRVARGGEKPSLVLAAGHREQELLLGMLCSHAALVGPWLGPKPAGCGRQSLLVPLCGSQRVIGPVLDVPKPSSPRQV